MEKKYVFIYGKERQLCSSPEQAVDFINSLTARGERHHLQCNANCMKQLNRLFHGEFVKGENGDSDLMIDSTGQIYLPAKISTTGCGKTTITVHPALADTLEEHQRIYDSGRETRIAENIRSSKEKLEARMAELNLPRKGEYRVSITYQRAQLDKQGEVYHVESTLRAFIMAESGMDAYNQVIHHLDNSPNVMKGSKYPRSYSSHFMFTFVGEHSEYSIAEW